MYKNLIVLAISFCSCFNTVFADSFSKLRVYQADNPQTIIYETSDNADIAAVLNGVSIRFEQWEATQVLSEQAQQQEVIAAYQADVDQLVQENGYTYIDVARMAPNSPKKAELRQKFLREHYHTEDEVRFFVEGFGLFYLHINDNVYIVRCEAGDLISIPANYRHWFDMSQAPYFTAIRFFLNKDGWIGHFTGSDIAASFIQD